ncbi:MAG: hypothetical protein NVSMB65_22130 [Chloroflexota bacterium]
MPRTVPRQVSSPESQDALTLESEKALYGEGVLLNGVDGQAARRAHMRAQTTARQLAEQHHDQPLGQLRTADPATRFAAARVRDAEKSTALAGIAAEHEEWLRRTG